MNPGDRVKFIEASDDQVNWGRNIDPRKYLQLNADYTITEVEIYSFHTKICLKGFDSLWFNAVHFMSIWEN